MRYPIVVFTLLAVAISLVAWKLTFADDADDEAVGSEFKPRGSESNSRVMEIDWLE